MTKAPVKPKQPRAPIDGIVRQRLVTKQTPADTKRGFVSIRPHATLPGGVRRNAEVELVKDAHGRTLVIPKLAPLRVPKLLASDVVVKLPRRLKLRTSLFLIVQYSLLAGIAVAAGYSTSIGQWFVLAYAVYALITRQDSRLSFGIALFVLVSVPFFQVINQPGVANNMAVYVYELLVVGTVQAVIELRREPKTQES